MPIDAARKKTPGDWIEYFQRAGIGNVVAHTLVITGLKHSVEQALDYDRLGKSTETRKPENAR